MGVTQGRGWCSSHGDRTVAWLEMARQDGIAVAFWFLYSARNM